MSHAYAELLNQLQEQHIKKLDLKEITAQRKIYILFNKEYMHKYRIYKVKRSITQDTHTTNAFCSFFQAPCKVLLKYFQADVFFRL